MAPTVLCLFALLALYFSWPFLFVFTLCLHSSTLILNEMKISFLERKLYYLVFNKSPDLHTYVNSYCHAHTGWSVHRKFKIVAASWARSENKQKRAETKRYYGNFRVLATPRNALKGHN